MTRVFVMTNHKGGVGKSTSATNVAFGLVRVLKQAGVSNPRVLLIDTDSQGHASLITTGRANYGRDDSLYTVLTAERKDAASVLSHCIVPSTWDEDLHVLPASPLLEAAERELMGVAGAPYRIADPLSRIADHYAAVVIDTRPSFSLMTEMGLLASSDAIVPVEPRYLETVGLLSVVNKINDIRDGWRHPDLHVAGILVTKLWTNTKELARSTPIQRQISMRIMRRCLWFSIRHPRQGTCSDAGQPEGPYLARSTAVWRDSC
jgi:chromosome partitioning protein